MHLDDFTRRVHDQLLAAAALGDERTTQIAQALATTADSAVRLTVIDAAAEVAAEVNNALTDAGGGTAPATVTTQLDGDDIRVNVTVAMPYAEPEAPRSDDGDATARITLRLSESLKADIEKAAAAADVSVNTWIVRALSSAAARQGAGAPFGPGGPFGGGWPPFVNHMIGEWQRGGHGFGHHGGGSNRISGWVTG